MMAWSHEDNIARSTHGLVTVPGHLYTSSGDSRPRLIASIAQCMLSAEEIDAARKTPDT